MKKRIRLKGRIRTYIQFTLYLGLLLLAIDAAKRRNPGHGQLSGI